MEEFTRLSLYWNLLYPDCPAGILNSFVKSLEPLRNPDVQDGDAEWYKDAVVYSLYVDLFNHDFAGLRAKLPYLQDLGVTCLWLLPILGSPGRDAGFDISDHYSVRPDLIGEGKNEDEFSGFVAEAHRYGIRLIFDVAINHTSDRHPWYLESRKSADNPYRQYYIWSDTPDRYAAARIIFKGIEESNWEKDGDQYFFHRFFNFQPDLNYRNPEVLFAMCRVLLYWQQIGIDGFRADAIPYLWKDEHTDCENRPMTHIVVKFFRAVLDYVKPGTLLLAEACQLPDRVVEYLGNGDECHAAYHFPLMPRMFKAIAEGNSDSIRTVLDPSVTPAIPAGTQWFTFLRCHDELSLERVYVTEAERAFIHQAYCHDPQWDFREGEGISARLAELMERKPEKILLAYSMMLSLPGTPVIYYGDEVGKLNDTAYYQEAVRLNGKDDTRFLVRGRMDWPAVAEELRQPDSLANQIHSALKAMIRVRKCSKVFGNGTLQFADIRNELLMFQRIWHNECWTFVHNLSRNPLEMPDIDGELMLGSGLDSEKIEAYGYRWIRTTVNE